MLTNSQVAIITGAARGIGLATAQLFHQNGYRVALVDRDETEVRLAASRIENAIAVTCDVSNPADVSNMIEIVLKTFGRIDALINNAGVA